MTYKVPHEFDRRALLRAAAAVSATGAVAISGCRSSASPPAAATNTSGQKENRTAMQDATKGTATNSNPPSSASDTTGAAGAPARMPTLFVGHGSPMNAIEDNVWSRGFHAMADLLPRPKAVLSISAHWFVRGTFVTGNERPETIHDFGGFPEALFAMQYPAPGDVALAKRVAELLDGAHAQVRLDWGLDHGTWSVLHHLIPAADVPVVQLSIDGRLAPTGHLEIGRALAPLRNEGVLIMGSGNVTHNLRFAMASMSRGDLSTPAWAARFDADVERAVSQHDGAYLARAVEGDSGRLSHPTLDHFLPLLYPLAASDGNDKVSTPVSGFDLGSLSMRSVLFG